MASQKPIVLDRPLRGRIYDSIAETIGNTPLVRIPNITAADGIKADICLKLEFFNPIASVKDRIGVGMILDMEASGKLQPGGTLVTCSCSHHVGLAEFTEVVRAAASDAGRRVQVLEIRGAAPDHPAVLTLPETSYLKCLICRVG